MKGLIVYQFSCVDGGTLELEGSIAGSVLVYSGGILGGTGQIGGDLTNLGGIVGPGFSPGILEIGGDYSQDALATRVLEIAGPTVGQDYDQLRVQGDLTLAGEVQISFLDGYVPPLHAQFDLMRFGGVFDATAAQFSVSGHPQGMHYVLTQSNGVFSLNIVAIPEPVWSGLLLPFLWLVALRRRRHRRGVNERASCS